MARDEFDDHACSNMVFPRELVSLFSLVFGGIWQVDSGLVVFWSLQLVSGQIIASVHDIQADLQGGKFTTATLLGKRTAIIVASLVWITQSIWSLVKSPLPAPIVAVHAAFGFGMLVGLVPIKLAYPAGFLFDVAVLWTSLPCPDVRLKRAIFLALSGTVASTIALPKKGWDHENKEQESKAVDIAQ